jgi:hypothetical protein
MSAVRSCRLPFQLLSGLLLVMALLDAPVASWPEPGRLVGVLVPLGIISAALLWWRARAGHARTTPLRSPVRRTLQAARD